MRSRRGRLAAFLALSFALTSCQTGVAPTAASVSQPAEPDETVLLGSMGRAEIEEAMPEWVAATIEAEPDIEAAVGLAELATRAKVTVFFGSWCSDSKRELSRLWKALDLVGGEVGFPIHYVGVDRSKAEPAEAVGDREILYVPTFVVERDGYEIGQVIEEAPRGIETDLLMLVSGESSGWISARDDLPKGESTRKR